MNAGRHRRRHVPQPFVGTGRTKRVKVRSQGLLEFRVQVNSGSLLADRVNMEARTAATGGQGGSLRCTLLDRRSSVPLAGARITCVGRDGRVSLMDSDERGNFQAAMPQGVYDLVISARGYLSLLVRGVGVLGGYHQQLTRALVPGEGQTAEGEPATALGGFVTDRLGRPVGNVTIHANSESGTASYTTRTDKTGAYVLHGVVPDMYDLTVRAMERTLLREYLPISHVKNFVRMDLRLIQM
jgi:hypothetical protein